jgi:hypothetical protein
MNCLGRDYRSAPTAWSKCIGPLGEIFPGHGHFLGLIRTTDVRLRRLLEIPYALRE